MKKVFCDICGNETTSWQKGVTIRKPLDDKNTLEIMVMAMATRYTEYKTGKHGVEVDICLECFVKALQTGRLSNFAIFPPVA